MSFWDGEWRTARKEHRCWATAEPILPGERYYRTFYVGDDVIVTKMTEFGYWLWQRALRDCDSHSEGVADYEVVDAMLEEFGDKETARAAWMAEKETRAST